LAARRVVGFLIRDWRNEGLSCCDGKGIFGALVDPASAAAFAGLSFAERD
jgi:hypothetical protein